MAPNKRAAFLLALLVMALTVGGPHVAAAQLGGEPPELGAEVVAETLVGTGPCKPRSCETGRNTAEFAPDGFGMTITGRCASENDFAEITANAEHLTMGDGGVSIEVRTVAGHERALIFVDVRRQSNGDGCFVVWNRGRGHVSLRKAVGRQVSTIASGSTAVDHDPLDWAQMSVRLDGSLLWVSINGNVVLRASDAALTNGSMRIGAGRTWSLADDAEVSVV